VEHGFPQLRFQRLTLVDFRCVGGEDSCQRLEARCPLTVPGYEHHRAHNDVADDKVPIVDVVVRFQVSELILGTEQLEVSTKIVRTTTEFSEE
jgi:hypothetical protein